MPTRDWKRVVFAADCGKSGICRACSRAGRGQIDYADCPCPGPHQDDLYEYQEFHGQLYARLLKGDAVESDPKTDSR